MTGAARSTAAAAAPATRRGRRGPRRPRAHFTLDEATVEAFAAAEPDWLAADRRAALARFELAADRGQPALHAVRRPARRRPRGRAAVREAGDDPG